jgi:hypothetical protein
MNTEEAVKEVADALHQYNLIPLAKVSNHEQLHRSIANEINFLITKDFSRLISVLYRLDISEKKLKDYLQQPADTPAANVIAEMIIERQLQKIESRKKFKNNRFCDEEKW